MMLEKEQKKMIVQLGAEEGHEPNDQRLCWNQHKQRKRVENSDWSAVADI